MGVRWVTNQSGGRLRSHVVTTRRPRTAAAVMYRPGGWVRTLCNQAWDTTPANFPSHPVCRRCEKALAEETARAESVGLL